VIRAEKKRLIGRLLRQQRLVAFMFKKYRWYQYRAWQYWRQNYRRKKRLQYCYHSVSSRVVWSQLQRYFGVWLAARTSLLMASSFANKDGKCPTNLFRGRMSISAVVVVVVDDDDDADNDGELVFYACM